VVDPEFAGDLPQRPITRVDQLDRVTTELLRILRPARHQDILPPDHCLESRCPAPRGNSRFGKHYRFTRGDVAEIVRLSAAPVKPPRRRVSVEDVAQDFRAA